MIDKAGRRAVLDAIRAYRDATSTNREFERVLVRVMKQSADSELRNTCDALWSTYDDLRVHKSTGRDALSSDELAMLDEYMERLQVD